eukprot:2675704-Amphidinium_carterae.2
MNPPIPTLIQQNFICYVHLRWTSPFGVLQLSGLCLTVIFSTLGSVICTCVCVTVADDPSVGKTDDNESSTCV